MGAYFIVWGHRYPAVRNFFGTAELNVFAPRPTQYKAQELNFNSWFRVHLNETGAALAPILLAESADRSMTTQTLPSY